ncbi:hypothetical protein PSI17_14730, partial [Xenorhabdus sp. IM139775]
MQVFTLNFPGLVIDILVGVQGQYLSCRQCAAAVINATGGDINLFAAFQAAAVVIPMTVSVDCQSIFGLNKSVLIIHVLIDLKLQMPLTDDFTFRIRQRLCGQFQRFTLDVTGLVIDTAGRLHGQCLIGQQFALA